MKASILSVGVVFLATIPFAYGGSVPDRTHGPCFHVNIQNDRMNESDVRQNCDRNYSRTVQAGAQNRAQTIQTGSINNNKVRQYRFDGFRRFGQRRHD